MKIKRSSNAGFSLRDLRYFVLAAERGHFSRAADEMGISQPTLSMQIRKLEAQLGGALFERVQRRVMLTALGQQALPRAQDLLMRADALHDIAKDWSDPEAGALRLGVFPTLAPYLLPLIYPGLAKNLPRLMLQMVEDKSANLLQQLQAGDLDAALLAMPNSIAGLQERALFAEPFWLALPTNHALARQKRVKVDCLAHENLLLLDEGHCLRTQALALCERVGAEMSQPYRATSLPTLLHMVAAGAGITLVPQLARPRDDEGLTCVAFAPPVPQRVIALYWRVSSGRMIALEKLMACVRRAAKQSGLAVIG